MSTANTITQSLTEPKSPSIQAPQQFIFKRMLKDFYCFQHTFLLGLLNEYFTLTVERPAKQSKVTSSMPRIVILKYGQEEINVVALTEKWCKERYLYDIKHGLTGPSATRRKEKNKKNFIMNLLFDLAVECGYFFDFKKSKNFRKSVQFDRIVNIYSNGKHFSDKKMMLQKGKALNDYLFELTCCSGKQRLVTLQAGDPYVKKLVNSDNPESSI
ncbi:TATA-binding protein-associated phosphoprotein [Entamoeba marina]